MWTTKSSIDAAGLDADRVWQALKNMLSGVSPSSGGTYALNGEFAKGTTVSVTPPGQETMTSEIVECDPPHRYADSTDMEGLNLVFRHIIEDQGDGVRLTKELEITGPPADQVGPEIGPQISADFPDTLTELVEQARALPQSN
ncbi:MAG: hypothetical protein LBJ44_06655 [Propionibacteriaceae bacterium]|jgi:hypothetical protein|nr:hypothetical protein [Propionibacteriaceae bacterium]